MPEKVSEFLLFHGMPLPQECCLGQNKVEFEKKKIFHREPPEILAPGTLNKSLGTKFLVSKFSSQYENKMLFYEIFSLIWQNMKFLKENTLFWPFLHANNDFG